MSQVPKWEDVVNVDLKEVVFDRIAELLNLGMSRDEIRSGISVQFKENAAFVVFFKHHFDRYMEEGLKKFENMPRPSSKVQRMQKIAYFERAARQFQESHPSAAVTAQVKAAELLGVHKAEEVEEKPDPLEGLSTSEIKTFVKQLVKELKK